jgi:hypothetical protein
MSIFHHLLIVFSFFTFGLSTLNAQVTITPTSIGILKSASTTFDVAGDARLNDNLLLLRGGTDANHALGWFNNYGGFELDGPVLHGFEDGALGTNQFGTRRLILQWQHDGRVFIPGGNTRNRLQVGGGLSKVSIGSAEGGDLNFGNGYLGFNASRSGNSWTFDTDGANNGGAVIYSNVDGNLYFANTSSTGNILQTLTNIELVNAIKMTIKSDGRIGIGTDNTPLTLGTHDLADYKLYVCGGILANEWLVPNVTWCDYVFEDDYSLRSLPEVEAHIEEHGHLHDTPSAEEVETNGLEVAHMTINQQEKIEELFLHMIEMDKRVQVLEERNNQLEQENAKLKATLTLDELTPQK